MVVAIRELRNDLSRYLRRAEAGERISVTVRGRVVAELVPHERASRTPRQNRWDELIAAGILHPPVETGSPMEHWPATSMPPGTAAGLIDLDRGDG